MIPGVLKRLVEVITVHCRVRQKPTSASMKEKELEEYGNVFVLRYIVSVGKFESYGDVKVQTAAKNPDYSGE